MVTHKGVVRERDAYLLFHQRSDRTPLLLSRVSARQVVRARVKERELQTDHTSEKRQVKVSFVSKKQCTHESKPSMKPKLVVNARGQKQEGWSFAVCQQDRAKRCSDHVAYIWFATNTESAVSLPGQSSFP